MYAVLFYEVDPAQFHRLPEVFPRHREHFEEFVTEGSLAMIGPLDDPLANGAMAIFRDRESAETFPLADPFVVEGIVRSYRIVDWDPVEFPAAD